MDEYDWIEVSQQEFRDFMNNYPNEISHDHCRIPEPPVDFFFDWSLAPEDDEDRWDKCVISRQIYDWDEKTYQFWLVKRSKTND